MAILSCLSFPLHTITFQFVFALDNLSEQKMKYHKIFSQHIAKKNTENTTSPVHRVMHDFYTWCCLSAMTERQGILGDIVSTAFSFSDS